MATKYESIVSEMLSKMTISEAVNSLQQFDEASREEITSELWRQYHAKCAGANNGNV